MDRPRPLVCRVVRAGGYLVSERLGNISMAAHLRGLVRSLEGHPGPGFPILLEKVLYDGTHAGDWIPREQATDLLKEVDTVLDSSNILDDSEKEFFSSMRRLCEASIKTGNPIA